MKRAGYVAAVVALALGLPALGQVRGVPASVTSQAPGRSSTPGPPASVTSLGPRGFSTGGHTGAHRANPCATPGPLIPSAMGCTPSQFTDSFFSTDGRHHGANFGSSRRRRANTGAYYPLFVPYAYPVPVEAEQEAQDVEPDPPAPTIFEHRTTSERVPYATSARPSARAVQETPEPSPADARQQIPVVLVYRDGHQQEVSNYAIVGQTLYDLGTFVAHKIPLADLNLKATIKANDDRGVEFTVPASVKLD